MSSLFSRSAVLTLTLAAAFTAPLLAQNYHVLTQWKVGGEGGWDYVAVDSPAHRLYVTHGTRVEVLDTESGKTVGAITGLTGVHGVAFDATGKYGYISDGHANTVVVFDRKTLAKVTSIPAGSNPDALLFEPSTSTVWAFNGHSSNATVIDTKSNKVVATVPLPGRPEFAVADGQGNIYNNLEDKGEIAHIDAKSRKVVATWPLGAESPSGLAIDTAAHHLFAVCDGKKMAVVDANTGKVLATPAIGDGPDAAGFDSKHKLAFSSNGDGTLTVIDASKSDFPVLETVKTERGARTMIYDAANDHIYLPTAQFGSRPAATAENPRPRPSIQPDSFTVLVVGR